MPCPDVFVQDVPTFVERKGLEFNDYLDDETAAVLDSEHCVRINYEAYFFGSLWNRERFLSDPVLYCGLVTDPISRRRFRPTVESPRARHDGVTYYFESNTDQVEFERAPDIYRLPSWKM